MRSHVAPISVVFHIHKYVYFICNVNQVLKMNISKDSGFKFMEQKCPDFYYYNPEVFFSMRKIIKFKFK